MFIVGMFIGCQAHERSIRELLGRSWRPLEAGLLCRVNKILDTKTMLTRKIHATNNQMPNTSFRTFLIPA
ncbi:hypothetical protein GBA52_026230 [Prunus armeniaca]|nr:hypothetical protein GBA52_026230 [Prunus armeniaca]